MRRLFTFFVILTILASIVIPAHAATSVNTPQPRWSYLNSVSANININSIGIATCSGRATARENITVKVVVRLQQLTDSGWSTIKSWTVTDTVSAYASGSYAVYSGYTYRTSVTGYVYDSNGNLLETGTSTDTYVY